MSASPELFREAWRKFPTGVTIVATVQEDGAPYFTTANAVSVGVAQSVAGAAERYEGRRDVRQHHARAAVRDQRVARGARQRRGLLRHGVARERQAFPGGHALTPSGVAILDEALSGMDCRVVQEVEAGDHVVFIGEVEHIEVRPGEPLVFYDGRYTALPSADGGTA